MALFFGNEDYRKERVVQGLNEWVNHPHADVRMPGLLAARATILPGEGHSFHRHPGREEVIYVLSGQVAQWIGQDRRELEAGACALIPAGEVHASFNMGDKPALLFVVLSGATSKEPMVVDCSGDEPWRSLPAP